MRFWEIADARNAAFCRRKHVPEEGWEACPADGCQTVSAMFGSWSDRPLIGTASSGFIFTLWTFKIWRKSRTKASFSHLRFHIFPLSLFEERLARKLRFHSFHFQILREVSHQSFVFISSAFTFGGKSRTKCVFERSRMHEMLCFARTKRAPEEGWGSLSGGQLRDGLGYVRIMVGSAPHWNCEFRLHFHTLNFRNLKDVFTRFHIFHFHFEGSLVRKLRFTSSTRTFWGTSRTKASFLHVPLLVFEGSAPKLRFHIFSFHFWREDSLKMCFWQIADERKAVFCWRKRVPEGGWEACPGDGCETVSAMFGSWSDRPLIGTASSGFIFTLWTFKIWRVSRTKASFSHLSLSHFEGNLERKLRFHIFSFHLWREVSHESFVFISSAFTFRGKSRTKCVCER